MWSNKTSDVMKSKLIIVKKIWVAAALLPIRKYQIIRSDFSRKEEAALAEKTLAIPLIGLIGYGATLEVLLFTETDIRAFAFFFIAGIMLADYRDLEIGK